jgi:hypothetical protein
MRTSIDIPDALFRAAKTRAAVEGRTLRELMLEGLSLAVQKPPAGTPPKKRLKRTRFPIIEGKKGSRILTSETVQQAIEDFHDDEARYYAEFVRR